MKNKAATEFGKMGGLAKLEKYGVEAYAEMGRRGVIGKKRKYGEDYYKKIALIGVAKRKAREEQKKRKPTNILTDFLTKGRI